VAELRSAHERLKGEFAELSAAALRHNRDDFLTLAQQAFAQIQEKSAGDYAARQTAIDAVVKPLRESLDKVDGKIAELEQRRERAYGELGKQLESLGSAQLRLHTETSRLATSLSATRTAGTWGELQLRRVVELAGLSSHCDFGEQVTPGGGERDRADLVVHLPGGQRIVVDAKAPTDAFRDAAGETDPVRRAAKLAEHANKVRLHVDALASRDYWTKFQPSPEFVILFLPGDQFLSAALEGDPALTERALARKVLLATPSTLIALLKAAAYGWRQEALSRNAEEVAALGRQLHDRLATFAEHLDRVGRGLEAAAKTFNAAVGSFEQTVLPGARRFAELGAKGAKELPSPARVETVVREISRKA
jgi:DNA recombination protein RmuC